MGARQFRLQLLMAGECRVGLGCSVPNLILHCAAPTTLVHVSVRDLVASAYCPFEFKPVCTSIFPMVSDTSERKKCINEVLQFNLCRLVNTPASWL